MVYRACSHHSRPNARNAAQINDGSGATVPSRVTENAALLAYQLETECVGEELTGQLVGIEPERDRINASNSVLGGYSRSRPPHARIGGRVRDELAHESVVILEGDNPLTLIT